MLDRCVPINPLISCTQVLAKVSDFALPFDGSHGPVDGLKCDSDSADPMVSSDAESVEEYLAGLPDDRRGMLSEVRDMVNGSIPEGYHERMNWGMVVWEVPLEVEPDTYNGEPLMFAGLASQKRHISLYMMPVYQDSSKSERLLAAYEKMGRKPNMGKSCIRFTKLEHLPMDVLSELISECDMESFVESCNSVRKK